MGLPNHRIALIGGHASDILAWRVSGKLRSFVLAALIVAAARFIAAVLSRRRASEFSRVGFATLLRINMPFPMAVKQLRASRPRLIVRSVSNLIRRLTETLKGESLVA